MPCGWGVKVGMVCVWVAGKTVWSPCYTRPYLSALEVRHDEALYKSTFTYFTFTFARCDAWMCLSLSHAWNHVTQQRKYLMTYYAALFVVCRCADRIGQSLCDISFINFVTTAKWPTCCSLFANGYWLVCNLQYHDWLRNSGVSSVYFFFVSVSIIVRCHKLRSESSTSWSKTRHCSKTCKNSGCSSCLKS